MDKPTLVIRRSQTRISVKLIIIAVALGTLGTTAAIPAKAATRAPATSQVLVGPTAISVNTLNWSGGAGFGSRSPAWYTDNSGIVHLQGAATQTDATGQGARLLGTLPRSARPDHNVFTIVHTFAGTYADLAIGTNGHIDLIDPRGPAATDYRFVSLEGITYRRSGPVRAVSVNTLNWSGGAGFGSRSPAWYTDNSGIVHLQGAATQTDATGQGARLLGTLPRSARPDHNVFTIVHTFAGTYADLAIGTNGHIDLIDPRGPAATDYRFVSLEGITYRR